MAAPALGQVEMKELMCLGFVLIFFRKLISKEEGFCLIQGLREEVSELVVSITKTKFHLFVVNK